MNEHTEELRTLLLSMLGERFGSDTAFERAAGLPPKTVSNWRLGRSASFMRMLPQLATVLGVRISDLIGTDESEDVAEARLLRLWRACAYLPSEEREALLQTLETVVRLYLGR